MIIVSMGDDEGWVGWGGIFTVGERGLGVNGGHREIDCTRTGPNDPTPATHPYTPTPIWSRIT